MVRLSLRRRRWPVLCRGILVRRRLRASRWSRWWWRLIVRMRLRRLISRVLRRRLICWLLLRRARRCHRVRLARRQRSRHGLVGWCRRPRRQRLRRYRGRPVCGNRLSGCGIHRHRRPARNHSRCWFRQCRRRPRFRQVGWRKMHRIRRRHRSGEAAGGHQCRWGYRRFHIRPDRKKRMCRSRHRRCGMNWRGGNLLPLLRSESHSCARDRLPG